MTKMTEDMKFKYGLNVSSWSNIAVLYFRVAFFFKVIISKHKLLIDTISLNYICVGIF